MIETVMQNSHHDNHEPALAARLEKAHRSNSDNEMKNRATMKVGFIGAGNVTATIGRHLINVGHTMVVSNSRGPETLGKFVVELGRGAMAGTKQQAAECDIVILATKWVNVPEALKGVDWRGRILVDATNAHVDSKADLSLAGVTRSRAALKGRTSSEVVAEMAVGARLVKSISNMPMEWIRDFSPNKPRTVIFTSGDDAEARQRVIELINSTGFVAIDLGPLRTGGAMQELGAPLSGIEFHFVQRLQRR
jgi:8-hydroxy-5-deazaflavin:NADPH oxidoreductase